MYGHSVLKMRALKNCRILVLDFFRVHARETAVSATCYLILSSDLPKRSFRTLPGLWEFSVLCLEGNAKQKNAKHEEQLGKAGLEI